MRLKILNIGSGKDRRENAINIDNDIGCRPDILCDAAQLPFRKNAFELVILKAVLEHSKYPHLVVNEAHRITKSGGTASGSAPFLTGYHGVRGYGDYFRFTDEGLAVLFSKFSKFDCTSFKGYFETMFQFSPLPKILRPLARFADRFLKSRTVAGYNFKAVK